MLPVIPLALRNICRAKAWGACAVSKPGSSFQARALLTYRPSMLPILTTFSDPIFHSTDITPCWLWLTVRKVNWSDFLFVCFYDKYLKKNHLKGERTDLISMSEFLSTLGWPHCFLPYFSGKLCKQVCSPRDCQEAKRQEGAGARCFFLGHTPGDLLPPKKCHRYKSTPCMVNPLLRSVPSWSNHFQQWQHMTPLQGWGGHLKSDPRGHGLVFNE